MRTSPARAAQGHGAKEETLTEILLAAASDRVRYVEFNGAEEASVGADWLWWFVDESGECLGLLVQAKRLKLKGSKWKIDFGYRSGGESQMQKLLDASTHLGVASAYVLYCGDWAYRGDLTCGPRHTGESCNLCDRAGVSMLAGLCAKYLSIGSDPEAFIDLGLDDVAVSALRPRSRARTWRTPGQPICRSRT